MISNSHPLQYSLPENKYIGIKMKAPAFIIHQKCNKVNKIICIIKKGVLTPSFLAAIKLQEAPYIFISAIICWIQSFIGVLVTSLQVLIMNSNICEDFDKHDHQKGVFTKVCADRISCCGRWEEVNCEIHT